MKFFSKLLVCVSVFSCIALFANENSARANFMELKQTADTKKDARSQYNVGVLLFTGDGVKQDCEEAVKYFKLSAAQGYGNAQCFLGLCYLFGKGVTTPDYTKAIKCFQDAAKQGIAEAEYNLGWCYENGKGVEANIETAKEWYRKAAAKGHTKAADAIKEENTQNNTPLY